MDPPVEQFEERLQEIETYLDLLDALERQVREGPPKIGGENITSQQQKVPQSPFTCNSTTLLRQRRHGVLKLCAKPLPIVTDGSPVI